MNAKPKITGKGTEAYYRQQQAWVAHLLGAEQCERCARYTGDGFCSAYQYPTPIPDAILAGDHDHTKPFEGDGGLTYLKRKDKSA